MIAFMGRRGTRGQIRLSAGFAGMAFRAQRPYAQLVDP